MRIPYALPILIAPILLPLGGCMVGPDYLRPPAIVSQQFKEAPPPGWLRATPADAAPKGQWWLIYNDPTLSALESTVAVSNQNVRSYAAQYRAAIAAVDVARSGLFPTLSGTAGVTRSSRGSGSTSSSGYATFGGTQTTYTVEGTADWDLDVWGRIRRQVESNVAAAQVGAADLANATLSAQALLATDYFQLRYQDALAELLTHTVAAYADTLRITTNQYQAGVTTSSDVAQAQAQLDTARASLIAVGVARAQYEHAIAVLTGSAPATLTLATAPLTATPPPTPAGIPSALLQRRPDIAAAERAMQQENALIGVQIAAFFPDISLSALYGYSGDPLSSLIQAANRVWSLGANATEVLFEGGLRNAEVAQARATYDASVATYRQTVLTALQQVEDALSGLRILEQQSIAEQAAVASAQHALQVALNQYEAGTQVYTTVVTAQTTLLGNQEAALAVQGQRMVESVTLVQALGGGFSTAQLPTAGQLQTGLPFLKY